MVIVFTKNIWFKYACTSGILFHFFVFVFLLRVKFLGKNSKSKIRNNLSGFEDLKLNISVS